MSALHRPGGFPVETFWRYLGAMMATPIHRGGNMIRRFITLLTTVSLLTVVSIAPALANIEWGR